MQIITINLVELHYLDPSTTSFIFQAIIAAGITVGVFFKNIKYSLINFVNKFKKLK
jgi:hypothetical protein|tara:strand:- start:7864 stop:8031 length:168 start_codon:yes stop_codon:yes gene_type:complete